MVPFLTIHEASFFKIFEYFRTNRADFCMKAAEKLLAVIWHKFGLEIE
jgi:hypothetical protein